MTHITLSLPGERGAEKDFFDLRFIFKIKNPLLACIVL